MTRVYRILRRAFGAEPLSGEGAYRYGGRWSSPGTRLAYTAAHVSLAMIDYFVHLDDEDAPEDLILVTAEVPADISRKKIAAQALPTTWRAMPAPPELTAIGDAFVRECRFAILVVPSALTPRESNWLINPLHPEFARIQVLASEPFVYDQRFFRTS